MLNFEYHNKTKIVFGKDTHINIGEIIKPYCTNVLLHYGLSSIKHNGIYDDVLKSLKSNNINFLELGGVEPNPRLSLIYEGIEICKNNKIDFILAVGGGSVIDSAKAIAVGSLYNGDVWDYFDYKQNNVKALPIATILTLPATGSESSNSTVVTNDLTKHKRAFRHEDLKPVVSIINPEIYFNLPLEQIAYGVCDMFGHIIERYFTKTKDTDLIDSLCESVMKVIMRNGLQLKSDSKNYALWSEIALAGNIAHNGILGLGREEDWATHMIEHELSAIYDIPHGAGLSIIYPAWMKYVYKENMDMFLQFAINVMGISSNIRNKEQTVLSGIFKLEEFFREMGLPTRLCEVGIDESNFEVMAKKCTLFDNGKEFPVGGIKKLYYKDIIEIYKLAI